jgi:transcriptional regulator with XRE-family HTH domain
MLGASKNNTEVIPMTFGEKLKNARKNAGLSQEQLAEKLCVSRAAVAKWETDKGLPDIMNLKAISKLLDVSIDTLLNDGEQTDLTSIKEAIDLNSLELYGRARCKHDVAVLNRFPQAEHIHQLSLIHQLNKIEWWADFLTCGLYTMIWGISHWKTWTGHYYLVDQGNRQFFVEVNDEFIIANSLPKPINKNKFYIGDRQYIRIRYDIAQNN